MANAMGSLYVGASGIRNSQNALNTTSNNLANVDTKGYVRQQVLYEDMTYTTFDTTASISNQQSGLGVSIADVVHARDIFLDKTFRTESGRSAFYSSTFETISEVETYFQELQGEAFQEILTGDNGLWAAFEELAKDPSDSVNQNLVIQKASLFVTRAQAVNDGLKSYQSNLNTQISDDIDRVNELGKTINQLNDQIAKIEAGGIETAMDLRDARDNALDELSTLGNISYKETHNGIVKVNFENVQFVDQNNVYTIGKNVDKITGFITPIWNHLSDEDAGEYREVFNFDRPISTANKNDIGELKALVLARGDHYGTYADIEGVSEWDYNTGINKSVIMNVQAELDQLIHGIVTTINDLFCPNTELDSAITVTDGAGNVTTYGAGTRIFDTENCSVGENGEAIPTELFTRTGTDRYTKVEADDGKTYYIYNEEDPKDTAKQYTTRSLSVNEDLLKQVSLFPAFVQGGTDDKAVDYQLGKALSEAWDAKSLTLNPNDTTPCDFAGYYTKMVGSLATLGDIYSSTADGLQSTVVTVENARLQVTGVSSDEELTNMIKYQNAYNASSRFVSVISEMIELLVTQLG